MDAILYFIIWAVLIFLMMRFGCGSHVLGHGHNHGTAGHKHSDRDAAITATSQSLRWVPPAQDLDPVCGKTVNTESAKSSVHDGMVYYFCSRDCREVFEAAPEQYLRSNSEVSSVQSEQAHA